MRWSALAFVVLFKFTDAFSGTMTAPFVIDLGFTRNDYAAIVKGVGLAATLIGGFAGGFVARRYSLADQPVDRRRPADDRRTWRSRGWRYVGVNQWALTVAIIGGEFHRRDRHGDLRRLSVGAVPEPAAHRDAIRAAHRARRGRAHLSVVRRGLSSPKATGWPLVLRDLRRGRDAEPDPAGLAAAARAFRRDWSRRRSSVRARTTELVREATQYSRAFAIDHSQAYAVARSNGWPTTMRACHQASTQSRNASSATLHFVTTAFAHRPRVLRAGDIVDLDARVPCR